MTGFFAVLLATSLAAGSGEFDRAAAEGAARIAVASIKERLVRSHAPADELKDAMLADPAKAVRRSDAEGFCRDIYLKSAAALLAGEVADVFGRLASSRRVEDAFPSGLVASASVFTDGETAAMMQGSFKKTFESARREACGEQAKGLAVGIRPSMSEADGDDDAALQRALSMRIAASQSRPVFEENLAFISEKMVKPIIADARREKKRQGEYVRRVRSDFFAPSALASDIASKLAVNVAERSGKAANPAMAWGIFPSVTNAVLRGSVERRIDRRYASFIAEVPLGVTGESLTSDILSDKTAHRKASDSERIARTSASAALLAGALEAAVKAAAENEREELSRYMKGRAGAGEVAKAAAARVSSDVVPLWRKARAGVVAREFAAIWPELAERTWYPSPETADDVTARPDYAQAVKAWRSMPQLAALVRDRASLEETSAKADAAVRAAFELARAAIAAQSSIVDNEMPGVLAEAVARKDSLWRRTPDMREIVSMLVSATMERWGETKSATLWPVAGSAPENASEQHAELFPSVRKKIELIARMIFKEMEKEPEERRRQPENPESASSDEEPEEELCTITFEMAGRSVKVKAEKGSRVIAERTEKATAAGFEKAVKEVGAIVGREILRLK